MSEQYLTKRQAWEKIFIAIILTALILTPIIKHVTLIYAQSQGAITSPIFEPGTQIETASYIIFREGDTYYAKNGSTGEIEFSGTDASQVVQYALDSGDKVFIKSGVYLLKSYTYTVKDGSYVILALDSNSSLIGEGRGNTILKVDFSASGRVDIIGVKNGTITNIRVSSLTIDGNYQNINVDYQCGIRTASYGNVSNVLLDNLEVKNCKDFGIYITNQLGYITEKVEITNNFVHHNRRGNIGVGYGTRLVTISGNVVWKAIACSVDENFGYPIFEGSGISVYDGAYEWSITGNIVYENDYQGIRVGAARKGTITGNTIYKNGLVDNATHVTKVSGGIFVFRGEEITISGNYIDYTQNAYDGILIYGDSHRITITGNTIAHNTGKGIRLYWFNSSWYPHDIVISSNELYANYVGIRLNRARNVTISSNLIHGCSGTALEFFYSQNIKFNDNYLYDNDALANFDSNTNLNFNHNYGFTTENSGNATISSSTSVTFEHGLAGTPTHVEVGWKDTGYGDWKWTANSTHITITVTNSGTYSFSWYAEYKP